MLKNSARSLIFDTLHYFDLYFNRQEFENEYTAQHGIDGQQLAIFDELCSKVVPPCAIIAPLFKHRAGSDSALFSFLSNNFASCGTLDSFIEKLGECRDSVYRSVLENVFADYSKNRNCELSPALSPENFLTALSSLECSDEYKLQISLFFGNYAFAFGKFTEALRTVYPEIEKLHKKYADMTEAASEALKSDDVLSHLCTVYDGKLIADELATCEVAVSILDPFLISAPYRSDNGHLIALGYNFTKVFSDDYSNNIAQASQFTVASGSELRMKMLEGLIKYGEMTLTDFSRYVDSQPTTVIRNLRMLVDGEVLCMSRREAQQIFYKANVENLKRVKINMNTLLDNLIKSNKS